MSTHMAPLPTSLPAGAARTAYTAQETTGRGALRKRPSGTKAQDPGRAGHHPRGRPAYHRCSCGKLREKCLRDRIRALWA